MDIRESFSWHSLAGSSCFCDILKSPGDNGGYRHSKFFDRNSMAGDRRRAAASMAHAYDHSLGIRLDFLPQFLVVIKVGACLAFNYPFRFGIFLGKHFLNFFE